MTQFPKVPLPKTVTLLTGLTVAGGYGANTFTSQDFTEEDQGNGKGAKAESLTMMRTTKPGTELPRTLPV